MWNNIGKVAEHKKSIAFLPSSGLREKLGKEGLQLFMDCNSATLGLQLGK